MRFFTKKKGWLIGGALLLCAAFCLICLSGRVKAAEGETNAQRIAFLAGFGWDVEEEPVFSGEVQIPSEFDQVYENYNQIQLGQGFDLRLYAGETVERYQYELHNYPNFPEGIRANLLIFRGKIIGGDICSIFLGGFMHGFSMQSGDIP